jgi:hypothetical protein
MSDISLLHPVDDTTWSRIRQSPSRRREARTTDLFQPRVEEFGEPDLFYYEVMEIMHASARVHHLSRDPSTIERYKWLVPLAASFLLFVFGLILGFEGRIIWVLPALMAGLYLLLFSLSQRVSERLGES